MGKPFLTYLTTKQPCFHSFPCRVAPKRPLSTMSSWTSTTTNTALQNASFTLLSCSGPTKGESLDIPRPSDFAIPIVWPSGHEQKINSIHDKMGNQEPFGPQEGEREGPDGPLCRNALVSLGSFVAIFRTRLRPPFLFVCLTPFPFALLFLFSFIRLIGPLYYCGLSWPFWSYHAVRRFLYVLHHRCC